MDFLRATILGIIQVALLIFTEIMHLTSKQSLLTMTSVLIGTLGTFFHAPKVEAALLVGNTDGNNVLLVDEMTGKIGREFIPEMAGYFSPDDLTYGPDGNLYVSFITDPATYVGVILKFDGKTGELLGRFDQGGDLLRPYGLAFGPDGYLYVSSFRSDEILRYDAVTGAFVDVFASGTGTANGLNGPNDLLFDADGNLYVTTQGSVADGFGGITYLFASQVLQYNIYDSTATPVVFDEPATAPGSTGFVSLLGLAFGPDGSLFVSDFANAIRSYDLSTGTLLSEFSSSTFGFMGNLTFDPAGNLYTPLFDFLNGNIGSISRFDASGNPLPGTGLSGDVFVPADIRLSRPIGIAYTPISVPEPATTTLGLLGLGVCGWSQRKRDRQKL